MPWASRGRGSSFFPPADPEARPSLRTLPGNLIAWTAGQIQSLHPGSFALVMATGAVSNALFLEGPRRLSDLLFFANAAAYVWLAGLTIVRAARFPGVMWSDLVNPCLVFAFFSFVAATGVFGEGAYVRGLTTTALYLWLVTLLASFMSASRSSPFSIPARGPTSFMADCWLSSAPNLW